MVQIRDGVASEAHRERRREILRAATEVFRERGFHAAGMREIAAALGIAVGKLYYYFESKQDLLAFCQEDTLRRLLGLLDRVRSLDLAPPEQLQLLVRAHIRLLNSGGSLAHLEVEGLLDGQRDAILALRAQYARGLQGVVSEGVRQGAFEDVDPVLAILALLGAANWTVRWFRPGGRIPLADIERGFARQQVRGLMRDPQAYLELGEDLVPEDPEPEQNDD